MEGGPRGIDEEVKGGWRERVRAPAEEEPAEVGVGGSDESGPEEALDAADL